MKKQLLTGLILILIIGLSSCRNDFEFAQSSGNLGFSQDTIFLDTIFSNIGSSTRTFKVYNRSDDDIVIPRVALSRGNDSRYRLAVDGVPGQIFENVELLANDSLYVFVETTVDIDDFSSGNEFLYEDVIEFDIGANQQNVQLITLVKDAIFLFPERDATGIEETLLLGTDDENNEIRISGFFLDDDQLNFTNEKPYVIYGFAAVPPDKTMTVEAGARLFFHNQSGIIAANESSVKINGALSTTEAMENEVIFEGDRLEPSFENVTGQWFGIWLTDGSKNHEISYTTIKNASIGIIMDNQNQVADGATLKIDNSKIFNSSNVGLLATTANITAENLIIHNAGQSALVARLGGTYAFNNCTISNYWNKGFRQDPALFVSNTIPNTELTEPLTQFSFTNGIVYGDRNIEFILGAFDGVDFNYSFENSLLRFNDLFDDFAQNALYDFNNPAIFSQVILNQEPLFEDVARNLLRIDDESGANAIANSSTATTIDISGALRGDEPDAGAFESVDLEL
ncbi:right-handed parallel beta-helix repeat-containing protein [Nonlabens agnitus]|uniref:Right handed beta helix domain-containing protein n=1 Tax=Nonlabens agnitus TaxID=870484 RepID=A0A2S9WRR1_9FLAO|nr:hypothetical protein [Nonlabens agnitus]PRP66180.1 hypothetical protein BST86_03275 [Nonlabens agnitus]